MQDKTINNALRVLRKQGGAQGMLAEVLLDMRGVDMPSVRQYQPAMRRGAAGVVQSALADGPLTTNDLAKSIRKRSPALSHRSAYNRAYQALLRLEERGLAQREGRLWIIPPDIAAPF